MENEQNLKSMVEVITTGYAVTNIGGQFVCPSDPADGTQCDSCQ